MHGGPDGFGVIQQPRVPLAVLTRERRGLQDDEAAIAEHAQQDLQGPGGEVVAALTAGELERRGPAVGRGRRFGPARAMITASGAHATLALVRSRGF